MTYTFAELEVSESTFDEIAQKLKDAGYDHAFIDNAIDMHGIGLVKEKPPEPKAPTDFDNYMALINQHGCYSGQVSAGMGEIEVAYTDMRGVSYRARFTNDGKRIPE